MWLSAKKSPSTPLYIYSFRHFDKFNRMQEFMGDSSKSLNFQVVKNNFLKVIFSVISLEIHCWEVPKAKNKIQSN